MAGVPVVYADSGSTDGSPALARRLGVAVVELDPGRPFSAGRGRNEGLARALALAPGLQRVQFVDGDSELVPGWLERAERELQDHPDVAAVTGTVRERHRDRSIYHRMCEIEWNGPPGDVAYTGGNAMYRVHAFQEAGGFRPGLVAGEEPDLCLRIRRAGWRILRVEEDMVRHDADMTRFAQWWRRAVRTGWGWAETAALQQPSGERYGVRQGRSARVWGGLVPALALGLAWPTRGASLLLFAGYVVLAVRAYRFARRRGIRRPDAALVSVFWLLAKVPQAVGQLRFAWRARAGRASPAADWRGAG
jgi:GT2 family glycosyltransferase